ncbi:hypothetical protein EDF34_2739 [Cellulomonas sp. PhB150]|nr:hypothetical protein EDF34_2739 [Cellulomonas sp. PhB150]
MPVPDGPEYAAAAFVDRFQTDFARVTVDVVAAVDVA